MISGQIQRDELKEQLEKMTADYELMRDARDMWIGLHKAETNERIKISEARDELQTTVSKMEMVQTELVDACENARTSMVGFWVLGEGKQKSLFKQVIRVCDEAIEKTKGEC